VPDPSSERLRPPTSDPEHGPLISAKEWREPCTDNAGSSTSVELPGKGSVMLEDVSISALHSALDGLASRQRAISDDIANVNTPYFRARSVSFEGDLKRALADGRDPLGVQATTVSSQAEPGLTGNNVNLADETVAATNTQLAYELALRATGDRFSLLRTAVKGA
jgi:flagellar basal-body rod protein FlgB